MSRCRRPLGCSGGRRRAAADVLVRAARLCGRCCASPAHSSPSPFSGNGEPCRLVERARDLPATESRERKDQPRSARVTRRPRGGFVRLRERVPVLRNAHSPLFPNTPSARLQRNAADSARAASCRERGCVTNLCPQHQLVRARHVVRLCTLPIH